MATVTSVVDAMMCALVDALQQREGLEDVQVSSGYLGGDSAAQESIQLTDVRGEQEWGALGNRRREERFTVDGIIWVQRPGKNEPDIREARERAWELLAELEDALRVDPGIAGSVKISQVTRYELEQGANVNGRWCQLDFEIECSQSLRSS